MEIVPAATAGGVAADGDQQGPLGPWRCPHISGFAVWVAGGLPYRGRVRHGEEGSAERRGDEREEESERAEYLGLHRGSGRPRAW